MNSPSAIVVFDIGKTNKKILVFDEDYRILHQESVQFEESIDEDGDPCEDIAELTAWITSSFETLLDDERFTIQAVNFSAYGASLVFVDETLEPVLPLYNYLKPYPPELQDIFYSSYGGQKEFAKETASPALGSLNSGLQLYRLKIERPELFDRVKYALHLPQYLSSIISKHACSEITSIGCHTNLWGFRNGRYHEWVENERVHQKLAPIFPSNHCFAIYHQGRTIKVGVGMHDSSAALLPYLTNIEQPFVLLSTGTWCISMNPFNTLPLTTYELMNDCLCYLAHDGRPIKASRLFTGHLHEKESKRLSRFFNQPMESVGELRYSQQSEEKVFMYINQIRHGNFDGKQFGFEKRDLSEFSEFSEAYHQLLIDIVARQLISTGLIQGSPKAGKIIINGGFSRNDIYMNLMAAVFPDTKIYSASLAEASALGAAMVIHSHWNTRPLQASHIQFKHYPDATKIA